LTDPAKPAVALPFTCGGPVTTWDGRAPTIAMPCAIVDAPPTSVIATVVG
jgi:hypothetical protein